jgi:very-short-patch-repair endonuclease
MIKRWEPKEFNISHGEELLLSHFNFLKIPVEREYRFHTTRRWRFDFAILEVKIACEVEGGTFINGRHQRGTGFEKDCEKYNTATIMGWAVMRYTTSMVKSGQAIDEISNFYIARKANI